MAILKIHNYSDVPPPFIFNPLKHHLGFIRQFIAEAIQCTPDDSELQDILTGIGAPMTDIYSGRLSVGEILSIVTNRLGEKHALSSNSYREWLKNEKTYRFIKLPDTSKWIFLEGRDPEHYIHFHPAKYSEYTFRVRGSTLRTVIAVKIKAVNKPEIWYDTRFVNELRTSLLGLSPVKHITGSNGIGRLMQLI